MKSCVCSLIFVPHEYNTQEVYERVVERNPDFLKLGPDHFMTTRMRDEAGMDASLAKHLGRGCFAAIREADKQVYKRRRRIYAW